MSFNPLFFLHNLKNGTGPVVMGERHFQAIEIVTLGEEKGLRINGSGVENSTTDLSRDVDLKEILIIHKG